MATVVALCISLAEFRSVSEKVHKDFLLQINFLDFVLLLSGKYHSSAFLHFDQISQLFGILLQT